MSDRPVRVSVRGELLVLAADGGEATVPLAELEALLLAHPQVSISGRALGALGEAGVAVVVGDAALRPAGVLLPIGAHGLIATRFAAQAALSLPARKRLWRQVVRGKVRNQAAALEALGGTDAGLRQLVLEVRSGDRTNVESQAAVRYWRRVFGDDAFRRDRSAGGRNALLNYGYAILRSSVARALCGAGLHPALGLHHHGRSNPLCLADDIMEPFRPVVDVAVARLTVEFGVPEALDADWKRRMVAAVTARVRAAEESRTCFDWQERTVRSLARVIDGEADRIVVPRLVFEANP